MGGMSSLRYEGKRQGEAWENFKYQMARLKPEAEPRVFASLRLAKSALRWAMPVLRAISISLIGLVLAGCHSSAPGVFSAGEIEGDEGEALVRYLIAHVPPLEESVPKEFCVVTGPLGDEWL